MSRSYYMPLLACSYCESTRRIEYCAACDCPACPEHRDDPEAGADSYLCRECQGGDFVAAVDALPPAAASSVLRIVPLWCWWLLAVLFGTLCNYAFMIMKGH